MIGMDSQQTARIISLVFYPPIVAAPTFIALILLEGAPDPLPLILISVLFGTFLPLAIIHGLSKLRVIPDVWASQRETRVTPFSGVMCSYLLGALVLIAVNSPVFVTSLMLSYLGNTVLMMIISLKWKISIHAAGIAGAATAFVALLGFIGFPLLLLVVPVCWARLRLKVHTPAQVTAGAILTIVAMWVQMRIYPSLL
jgi:membrane-associated phospholipid phosphatase